MDPRDVKIGKRSLQNAEVSFLLTASVWVDRNGREMVDIIIVRIYVCAYRKQMRIYVLFGKGDAVRGRVER